MTPALIHAARAAHALAFVALLACAKPEAVPTTADAAAPRFDLPFWATDPRVPSVDLSGGDGAVYASLLVDAGPQGDVVLGSIKTSVPIPNVDGVLQGLRKKMRLCYAHGLERDPTLSGALTMKVKVAPNGEVASATADATQSALDKSSSVDVVKCLKRTMLNSQFDAPGAEGATLEVPLTLVPPK